ncbi:MAG: hypothetical protein IKE76_09480 [Clostridia bacterium]|nr:hypothetical protein [Clostridia bacterium]
MYYTDEQFQALAAYEDRFALVIRARYARNPGRDALRAIHDAYCAATKTQGALHANCAACIVSLLTGAGKLYFDDKKEREAQAAAKKAQKKAVELSQEKAEPTRAKVATKKSNKATKKAAK